MRGESRYANSPTHFSIETKRQLCVLLHALMTGSTPKGGAASRLRQRKYALLRRFQIPRDALPGSLALTHRRCGTPTCHCAQRRGTSDLVAGFHGRWQETRGADPPGMGGADPASGGAGPRVQGRGG
jgi:hypothetical protein